MDSYEFMKRAKQEVSKWLRESMEEGSEANQVDWTDVAMVFNAYTLGFSKATFYAPDAPGLYFEVTYNKSKKEMYVDVYNKRNNFVVEIN